MNPVLPGRSVRARRKSREAGLGKAMRVLAYIHSFNAADIIDRTLKGIQTQTRPPDAILLVDNASTDGTLDRTFSENVNIIRNSENVGPSGAIPVGFNYALDHGFDWMWILDHDSVPEPNALETLLELYSSWPQNMRDQTAFVACLPRDEPDGRPRHGRMFTRRGRMLLNPPPMPRYYQCHVTIWSGSLYRLSAVRQIGLPNPHYFIDRGELEYTYRVMKADYKGFIHQDAVLRHQIRAEPLTQRRKLGPITVEFVESPALRCYYVCRNTLYFTLYDFAEGRWAKLRELWRVRSRPGRGVLSGIAWQTSRH